MLFDVLAVHEVCLVEQSHLRHCLTADHQESAGQYVDGVCLVVVQMPHIVGGKTARVGEQPCQPAHLVERCRRSGESPLALLQVFSLAVEHLHSQSSAILVRTEKLNTSGQRVAFNDGVGIQQQRPVSCAKAQGLVVGCGKALVVGVGNQLHLAVTFEYQLSRPVHRGIVHYPHLQLQPAAVAKSCVGVEDRIQTLVKEILDVVTDYDNAQSHAFFFLRAGVFSVSASMMISFASSMLISSGSRFLGKR